MVQDVEEEARKAPSCRNAALKGRDTWGFEEHRSILAHRPVMEEASGPVACQARGNASDEQDEGQAASLQTRQRRHEAGKERDASPWEQGKVAGHHNRYSASPVVLDGEAWRRDAAEGIAERRQQ